MYCDVCVCACILFTALEQNKKTMCHLFLYTQCGIIISSSIFSSHCYYCCCCYPFLFMPLANSVRCICFDLFRLTALYTYTFLCSLFVVGIILFFVMFGDSGEKKLPFFGCRFFLNTHFSFSFLHGNVLFVSIRLPCLTCHVVCVCWARHCSLLRYLFDFPIGKATTFLGRMEKPTKK